MPNPGIFISAPQASTPAERAQLLRELSALALACGFPAHRGKTRGGIYRWLAATVARRKAILKIWRRSANSQIRTK